MSSSFITSEEGENEREPLKRAMDNRGFDHSNGNSQAELETKQDENSEPPQQQLPQDDNCSNNNNGDEDVLKYGAKHVIMLFVPVGICMALVVAIVTSLPYYTLKGVYFAYTPFEQEEDLETSTKIWQSLANTAIMLVVVIVLTIMLLLLYKYRCYKFIYGWLFCSSLMLLSIFILLFLTQLFIHFNVVIDFLSLAIILWNFGVVGMINIHWKGPLLLQQLYLLTISALMAVTFIKHLPDWTTWALLGGISLWDIVAVLTPRGPLQSLVKLAQERNEPIFPALIYSTTMVWLVDGEGKEKEKVDEGVEGGDEEEGIGREGGEAGRGDGGEAERGDGGDDVADEAEEVQNVYGGMVERGEVFDVVVVDGSNRSNNGGKKNVDVSDEKVGRLAAAGDQNVIQIGEIAGTSGGGGDGGRDGLKRRGGGKADEEVVVMMGVDGDQPPTLIPIFPDDACDVQVVNLNNSSEAPVSEVRSAVKKRVKKAPQEEEDSGVKLGLGDFIFYSILVGKASTTGDWNTTIACFIAILIGLSSTLILLAIFKKALPALPISVSFGLVFYFATSLLVRPFLAQLIRLQIFI